MKKYDDKAPMQILKEFWRLNMMTVKECSETMFFREWSKYVFHSL